MGVTGCLIVAAICCSAVVDCSQNGHGPGGLPILGVGDRLVNKLWWFALLVGVGTSGERIPLFDGQR